MSRENFTKGTKPEAEVRDGSCTDTDRCGDESFGTKKLGTSTEPSSFGKDNCLRLIHITIDISKVQGILVRCRSRNQ